MKELNRILSENEREYFKRYAESLQDKWDGLEEELRTEAIGNIEQYINDPSFEGISFGQDEILRIVIGYRCRKCLLRIMDNTNNAARIVIWEPDIATFLAGCACEDISDIIIDSRVTFVFGHGEMSGLERVLAENTFEHNVHHRKIVGFGDYLSEGNEDLVYFSEVFRNICQEAIRHGTLRRTFGQFPCKNMLYAASNLNNNYSIAQLFQIIPTRDIPVIIVSAGPSLDKNVAELKRAYGKAIIIAVTHAMKTLNHIGFEPDMVAVTDAKDKYFADSAKLKRCNLISSVFAAKEYQKAFNGRIIYHGFDLYEGLFRVERTMSDHNWQLDTGSVATDIFSLLMTAGFKTIILVGQDLAYDENGYSHANNETEKAPGYLETMGIYGKMIQTRSDWIGFKDYFESWIKIQPQTSVIDATEGGALIEGTRIMTLRDAIDEFCVKDYPIEKWRSGLKKGDGHEAEEIRGWFELMENNCVDTSKHIVDAININEAIKGIWQKKELWDDDFSALCKRYDILYGIVMNGSRAELLRCFCASELQNYLENALVLEGDENIEKRMQMEYELLKLLEKKILELTEYLRNLNVD